MKQTEPSEKCYTITGRVNPIPSSKLFIGVHQINLHVTPISWIVKQFNNLWVATSNCHIWSPYHSSIWAFITLVLHICPRNIFSAPCSVDSMLFTNVYWLFCLLFTIFWCASYLWCTTWSALLSHFKPAAPEFPCFQADQSLNELSHQPKHIVLYKTTYQGLFKVTKQLSMWPCVKQTLMIIPIMNDEKQLGSLPCF